MHHSFYKWCHIAQVTSGHSSPMLFQQTAGEARAIPHSKTVATVQGNSYKAAIQPLRETINKPGFSCAGAHLQQRLGESVTQPHWG